MAKQKRMTVADLRVAYRDEGVGQPASGSGREPSSVPEAEAIAASRASLPLLLLHGAVQTRAVWDAQFLGFAQHRRVIAPDLRGHGETEGSFTDMTIEQLTEDAFGLLDALGIDSAVVCGISLGGMVALQMAVKRPARIAALVVVDTPLALSLKPLPRRLIETVGPQRLLAPIFKLFGQRRTGRIGLALVRSLCGKGWVGAEAEHHLLNGFGGMAPAAIIATYGAIVAADPPPVWRLAMPCLVVVGRRETTLLLDHAEIIARRIEGAEIVKLDAGHAANLDDPAGFNAAVGAFIEAVSPT